MDKPSPKKTKMEAEKVSAEQASPLNEQPDEKAPVNTHDQALSQKQSDDKIAECLPDEQLQLTDQSSDMTGGTSHDQPPSQSHDQPQSQSHDQPPPQSHDQPPSQSLDQPLAPSHDQKTTPATADHEQPQSDKSDNNSDGSDLSPDTYESSPAWVSDEPGASSGQYEADVSGDELQSSGDRKFHLYKVVFSTAHPPPRGSRIYLTRDEITADLDFPRVFVDSVDEYFMKIEQLYNPQQKLLRRLKAQRVKVLTHCFVWPRILDSAMKYLKHNGVSALLWQTSGDLKLNVAGKIPIPVGISTSVSLLYSMIRAINSFTHRAVDPNTITIMKRITSGRRRDHMLREVQQVHSHRYPVYVEKCQQGLQMLQEFPRRWEKMVDEMNDITDEFIIALQHLMNVPIPFTRETKPSATFSPEESSDEKDSSGTVGTEVPATESEREGTSEEVDSSEVEQN